MWHVQGTLFGGSKEDDGWSLAASDMEEWSKPRCGFCHPATELARWFPPCLDSKLIWVLSKAVQELGFFFPVVHRDLTKTWQAPYLAKASILQFHPPSPLLMAWNRRDMTESRACNLWCCVNPLQERGRHGTYPQSSGPVRILRPAMSYWNEGPLNQGNCLFLGLVEHSVY